MIKLDYIFNSLIWALFWNNYLLPFNDFGSHSLCDFAQKNLVIKFWYDTGVYDILTISIDILYKISVESFTRFYYDIRLATFSLHFSFNSIQ